MTRSGKTVAYNKFTNHFCSRNKFENNTHTCHYLAIQLSGNIAFRICCFLTLGYCIHDRFRGIGFQDLLVSYLPAPQWRESLQHRVNKICTTDTDTFDVGCYYYGVESSLSLYFPSAPGMDVFYHCEVYMAYHQYHTHHNSRTDAHVYLHVRGLPEDQIDLPDLCSGLPGGHNWTLHGAGHFFSFLGASSLYDIDKEGTVVLGRRSFDLDYDQTASRNLACNLYIALHGTPPQISRMGWIGNRRPCLLRNPLYVSFRFALQPSR